LLSGDPEESERAHRVLSELKVLADRGDAIDSDRVERVITMVGDGVERPSEVLSGGVPVAGGKMVRPKTAGQRSYIDAIAGNTITFGIGPAGTGKTYLAVAAAVEALRSGEVRRIILTRPAVEAGERLGFLPGDLAAKIDPYLRPLYDALYDMLGTDDTSSLMDRNTIEVAPLAYMRGRTLNDAFIILDEAQNTSPEQMKMFLTRLGFNSKMVVTGDVTQVDLPSGNRSGLRAVRRVLEGIEGIGFIDLTGKDVVRARIVRDIVAAYEALDSR
jgi:phosphate starvation-inducible PhoH-like protein